MRLEKRIRALEARLISDPVILHFADGSTRELHGPGDFMLRLFSGVFGGAERSPRQAEQLELIGQCVFAEEPGGARMVEVLQCLMHAAAEGRSETEGQRDEQGCVTT